MGFLDRLFGTKDSAAGPMISVNRLGVPVWSGRNYEKFSREAYIRNVIGYRCVRLISENIADLEFQLHRGDDELTDHPLLSVIAQPNPFQGKADFIDAVISFWRLSGNAYIEAVMLRGDIKEMFALRSDRMKVIPGARGYPAKWRYTVNGNFYDFDVELPGIRQQPILHIKDFHPTDDFYGLSPVEAASYSVDVHNSASAFNKSLLDNSASPSGAFIHEGKDGENKLTDTQYSRLKGQMTEEYAGAKNAGKMMLLEGGLKWMQMGLTPKELEYTDGKNQTAREIALAFGVPPMLLGIPGDNSYANYKEANSAFHRQTILPLAGRLCSSITNWVQPTYPGVKLSYDADQIDALSDDRAKTWDRISKADFLTDDEKRTALGYGPYKAGTAPTSRLYRNGGQTAIEDLIDLPVDDPNAGGIEPAIDDEDAE